MVERGESVVEGTSIEGQLSRGEISRRWTGTSRGEDRVQHRTENGGTLEKVYYFWNRMNLCSAGSICSENSRPYQASLTRAQITQSP